MDALDLVRVGADRLEVSPTDMAKVAREEFLRLITSNVLERVGTAKCDTEVHIFDREAMSKQDTKLLEDVMEGATSFCYFDKERCKNKIFIYVPTRTEIDDLIRREGTYISKTNGIIDMETNPRAVTAEFVRSVLRHEYSHVLWTNLVDATMSNLINLLEDTRINTRMGNLGRPLLHTSTYNMPKDFATCDNPMQLLFYMAFTLNDPKYEYLGRDRKDINFIHNIVDRAKNALNVEEIGYIVEDFCEYFNIPIINEQVRQTGQGEGQENDDDDEAQKEKQQGSQQPNQNSQSQNNQQQSGQQQQQGQNSQQQGQQGNQQNKNKQGEQQQSQSGKQEGMPMEAPQGGQGGEQSDEDRQSSSQKQGQANKQSSQSPSQQSNQNQSDSDSQTQSNSNSQDDSYDYQNNKQKNKGSNSSRDDKKSQEQEKAEAEAKKRAEEEKKRQQAEQQKRQPNGNKDGKTYTSDDFNNPFTAPKEYESMKEKEKKLEELSKRSIKINEEGKIIDQRPNPSQSQRSNDAQITRLPHGTQRAKRVGKKSYAPDPENIHKGDIYASKLVKKITETVKEYVARKNKATRYTEDMISGKLNMPGVIDAIRDRDPSRLATIEIDHKTKPFNTTVFVDLSGSMSGFPLSNSIIFLNVLKALQDENIVKANVVLHSDEGIEVIDVGKYKNAQERFSQLKTYGSEGIMSALDVANQQLRGQIRNSDLVLFLTDGNLCDQPDDIRASLNKTFGRDMDKVFGVYMGTQGASSIEEYFPNCLDIKQGVYEYDAAAELSYKLVIALGKAIGTFVHEKDMGQKSVRMIMRTIAKTVNDVFDVKRPQINYSSLSLKFSP